MCDGHHANLTYGPRSMVAALFMKRTLRLAMAAFVLSYGLISVGAVPLTKMLWPKGAPGAKGEEAKDKPTLIIYLPEKPSGAGIVICPGGGYGGLAMDHEGHQIGRWLNEHGIAGFICDYRHRGK